MMTDTLCHTVIPCIEPDATSRGAALVAFERIGAIRDIGDLPAQLDDEIRPDEAKKEIYIAALENQRWLYRNLFEE